MRLEPETIRAIKNLGDAIAEVFELIKRDLIQFFERVKEARETIKESEETKHNWVVPRKISLSDQVLIRKPLSINIRANL